MTARTPPLRDLDPAVVAAVGILGHHRPTVIDDRPAEIDRRLVRHQVMVHGIPAGVGATGEQHDIAHFERSHLLLRERRPKHDFTSSPREA